MSDKVKVYVTKYALTNGITVTEGVKTESGNYCVKWPGSSPISMSKGHVFQTWEQAVVKAETMRRNKIASLQKQIKALEQLKFD